MIHTKAISMEIEIAFFIGQRGKVLTESIIKYNEKRIEL
jgi:hypothetical protein